MREKLKGRLGTRGRYTATFDHFGQKTAYKGPPVQTLLFTNVTDSSGEVVTDHIWFTMGKQFARLNLKPGDVVSFEARVDGYWKGYQGWRDDVERSLERDYRLVNPTKVRKVEVLPVEQLPLFGGKGD